MTEALPILNPNIYLNYFPPDVAKQFEFARNLFLVTLGALLSDIFITLPEDWILIKSGLKPTLVAYFLSRVSTLAFILSCVLVKTMPEAHCSAQELGVALCWIICTASSSFLFLRRAHAAFYNSKRWRYFYTSLYVINVGISFVVPIGSRAGHLGQTGWCINTRVETYVTAAVFSRLLFDSCVFLGISYELATSQGSQGAVTWRTLVTGEAYSRLMRAFLRGGQQYYLMSVCSNLLIVLLIIIPGVPPLFQAMFNVPDIALSSSMACRVFRNLKLSTMPTGYGRDVTMIEFGSAYSAGFHTEHTLPPNPMSSTSPCATQSIPSTSVDKPKVVDIEKS